MDCKLSLEVVAFSLRLFRRCITGIILPFLRPLVPWLFSNRHILFILSFPLFPTHLHLVVNHFFHDIATFKKVVDTLFFIAIGLQLLIDEVDLRKIMKLILAVFLLARLIVQLLSLLDKLVDFDVYLLKILRSLTRKTDCRTQDICTFFSMWRWFVSIR